MAQQIGKKNNTSIPSGNFWSQILNEAQQQSRLSANKFILVLGDNGTGKTTLIGKLHGVKDPPKGLGLEYAYIDVKDEDCDDSARLGVWILDGESGHTNLLRFALNEKNFEHTTIMLIISMTEPWNWLDQLNHWIKVLSDHTNNLNLSKKLQQEAKQRLQTMWQTYCEAGDKLKSPMKRNNAINADFLLPLTKGALTTNLGLDIVVVVTKTDYMKTLAKIYDYQDEHFEYIQQWIRRFCLQYGAALFYTSVKNDVNCDLLYKYLTHRIYKFPLDIPAMIVDKEALLIPAGWDSLQKIDIICENLKKYAENNYSDVIRKPSSRNTAINYENIVEVEDEQEFLRRHLEILKKDQDQKTNQTSRDNSPKKVSDGDVLTTFFNSLLNKAPSTKSHEVSSVSSNESENQEATEREDVRKKAAAELDRLSQNFKKRMDFSQKKD